MKPIIEVLNVSKQYRIVDRRATYGTLRDVIANSIRAGLRSLGRGHSLEEVAWALKNVSFKVMPGEVVGIIGANGAGKSTLLKILSRITRPTSGQVDVYGRVGSLLEVGTGFHGELSGRENIYLNGAILGMKRKEIDARFDEIVAFAEIARFIETPVKYYSSGMYMRLAFAVAASLESDVLLVDEVLAVGDASFQRKCLGKMADMASDGRTVLLVSHNPVAIVSLCQRCLFIEQGSLVLDGPASEVMRSYQERLSSKVFEAFDLSNCQRSGTGRAHFTSIQVTPLASDDAHRSSEETHPRLVRTGQDLRVEVEIASYTEIVDANVAMIIYDSNGYRLIDANTAMKGCFLSLASCQRARVQFVLHDLLLRPGLYFVGLWLGRGGLENIDDIAYAKGFSLEADPETVRHPEVFPGPYQCAFSHAVEIGGLQS